MIFSAMKKNCRFLGKTEWIIIMETIIFQNISDEIEFKLSKIISSPFMYPEFPQIPEGIFSSSGEILWNYSLYKKGWAYFVLNDWKWEYREWMEVLDTSKIVFAFTQYELDSPHVGKTIRNMVSEVMETPETQMYEEALKTVIFYGLYNTFSEDFWQALSNKLFELSGIYKESMYSYLEKISLVIFHGYYIVLDADIHFSRQELEQIKRVVFS